MSASSLESVCWPFVGGDASDDEQALRRILLAGRLITSRGEHLCRIRHISTRSMIVECITLLQVGATVRVELRNRVMLDAHVAWIDEGRARLVFRTPIAVDAILQAEPGSPDRPSRAPRLSARCRVLLWHVGRERTAALYDVSQSGCRLLLPSPPAVGTEVRISIPGLPSRHAVTRWSADERGGFLFREMLSFGDLSRWERNEANRIDVDVDDLKDPG